MIIIHILISIVFNLILWFLSINLLGFFVRSVFFAFLEVEYLRSKVLDTLKLPEVVRKWTEEKIEKAQRNSILFGFVVLLLIIGYLYATYYFGNIGITVVALMHMISRLPDLLWEIITGQDRPFSIKTYPKNVLFYITPILWWATFPVLYYFLYHF
ncbi:MAG: hypothetical protein C4348_01105 [Patescibacteria group bacterium]